MRIKLPHVPYVSHKIAIDLLNCGFVKLNKGIEPIVAKASEILTTDVQKERALDERVNELLEKNEDEMQTMQIDRKNKLAGEFDVILTHEDRFSNVAHKILEAIWKSDLVEYNVSENRVKNVIYSSIDEYLKSYEKIEDSVYEMMQNYKRKLIPGTDEYDLIFERLYQDELKKRGML